MKPWQIFIKSQHEWHKRELYKLIGVIFLVIFLLRIVFLPFVVLFIVSFLLLIKTFTFASKISFMPAYSNSENHFSWLYYQALPLHRKELLMGIMLSRLYAMIPSLLLSFLIIFNFSGVLKEELGYSSPTLVWFLSIVSIYIFFQGFLSIKSVILHPRTQYQKDESDHIFYLKLKNFLAKVVIIYGILILLPIFAYVFYLTPISINNVTKFIELLFLSWWILIPLFIQGYWNFYSTLRAWAIEKIGHTNLTWKASKDIPLTLLYAVIVVAPIYYHLSSTPEIYQGDPSLKFISEGNQSNLEDYVMGNKLDLRNYKNKHGLTLLMAATLAGNTEAYSFLKTQGFNYNNDVLANGKNIWSLAVESQSLAMIKIVFKDYREFTPYNEVTGASLLHLAANTCRADIVDFLIKNGADVHALDKQGKSPTHIAAAKEKCFGALVALQEAGARFDLKDHSGALPLDYANKRSNKEMVYFLNKHSRAPAAKYSK